VDRFQPELRPEDTGARLRAVRELTGLSSRDVARAAGLSKREVAAVERGRRRLTLDELRAVSVALNVDPQMLTADTGDGIRRHEPDHGHALPAASPEPAPAAPFELPNSERRRDFMTRKRVEDSWSDLRAEMDGVIRQCMRVSTIGSGDDALGMLDALEAEIRSLKTNRTFHREVARHERTIAEVRGGAAARRSRSGAESQ
jgi:transcriptional regulator with XRE-family HTH domain